MNQEELALLYKGIGNELKYWTHYVQSGQYKSWLENPVAPELDPFIVEFIKRNIAENAKVLDVGSGIFSILHGLYTDITAADPLGEMYECIFDYKAHGLTPCVPVSGENLTFDEQFDLVFMRNSLDHSQMPSVVLDNLIRACKKGGYVIVSCWENEGYEEQYVGFHQWNITLNGDKLKFSSKNESFESKHQPYYCDKKTINDIHKKWITWIYRK